MPLELQRLRIQQNTASNAVAKRAYLKDMKWKDMYKKRHEPDRGYWLQRNIQLMSSESDVVKESAATA
jgi:homoserine acetyltransferase